MKALINNLSSLGCSPHGDHYITDAPLYLAFDIGWKSWEECVPVDYDWDGASLPRIFWRILGTPFDPRTMRASCVHDYLYWTQPCTRAEADAVLRAIMILDGCSHLRANLYWLGVRIGGWIPWKKYKKENRHE